MTTVNDRMEALKLSLSLDSQPGFAPVIEVSKYDDKEFDVNPHTTHDGTSPASAKKSIELVRKALRIVVGPETDDWNTGTLMEMDFVVGNNREIHKKLAKTLTDAEQALPVISYDEDLTKKFSPVGTFINRLVKKGVDWTRDQKVFDKVSTDISGGTLTTIGRAKENHYVLIPADHTGKFGSADYTDKVKAAWETYWQAFKLAESEMAKMKGVYNYDMLVKMFRENPETLEMTKVGIHDLVNSLYHISPAQFNGSNSDDHVLTLREAFNGNEVTDRTKGRQTADSSWTVLTEEEADEAVREYIEETLWAFNYSFLGDWFILSGNEGENTHGILAEKCEDGNEGMKAMVQWEENAGEIIAAAVEADGRGHFMNSYDGNEITQECNGEMFYIYRTN